MSRAGADRQNQREVIREHYRDIVNIWRPTSIEDSYGLITEAPPQLLYARVPLHWVNRKTFTQNLGIGFLPDPKHDSTDEVWLAGQIQVRARDLLDVVTPGQPALGYVFSLQGEPEPFFNFFNQVACIIRWTQRPEGMTRFS